MVEQQDQEESDLTIIRTNRVESQSDLLRGSFSPHHQRFPIHGSLRHDAHHVEPQYRRPEIFMTSADERVR